MVAMHVPNRTTRLRCLYMALPLILWASLTHADDNSVIQYEDKSWNVQLEDFKIIETGGRMVMHCKELECADRMKKAMKAMDDSINTAIVGKDAASILWKLLTSKHEHSQWHSTMKECVK